MRILHKTSVLLDLADLGFCPRDYALMDQLIQRPDGIILVTGPTGSGKTTTLYACLNRINDADRNILTAEDPVEYEIRRHPPDPRARRIGLTFASALRAFLRQDPDVIMVGEIRDKETAEIAIHASLTGHLVLSTIHTNDAAGAVTRLVEMEIEPFLVRSSVIGILAQRLVRVLCQHCKVPYRPTDYELDPARPRPRAPRVASAAPAELAQVHRARARLRVRRHDHGGRPMFYKAGGCDQCMNKGFVGPARHLRAPGHRRRRRARSSSRAPTRRPSSAPRSRRGWTPCATTGPARSCAGSPRSKRSSRRRKKTSMSSGRRHPPAQLGHGTRSRGRLRVPRDPRRHRQAGEGRPRRGERQGLRARPARERRPAHGRHRGQGRRGQGQARTSSSSRSSAAPQRRRRRGDHAAARDAGRRRASRSSSRSTRSSSRSRTRAQARAHPGARAGSRGHQLRQGARAAPEHLPHPLRQHGRAPAKRRARSSRCSSGSPSSWSRRPSSRARSPRRSPIPA